MRTTYISILLRIPSFILSFLVALAVSDLTCTTGQTYVKFTKYSTNYATEESWEVYNGSTKEYTSPTLVNLQYRTVEVCLPAAVNNQYTLKLKDSYGDSWTAGSWLQAEGLYGNIAFRTYLTAAREESYALSLYYAVKKNDFCKLTSGSMNDPNWTQYNYSDNSWNDVTLGSVTTAVSGPQYFRKSFTGLANMAAYELSMNYRFGIVAYVNGNEVYRDNMPEGPITSSSLAVGSYPAADYHNIIRSGSEVANSQSILAVEIHFMDAAGQTFVDFDSFLAIYATTILDNTDPCYIYPYNTAITSTSSASAIQMFDFNKTTAYYIDSSATLPYTLNINFNGPRPFINGLRVWPYTNPATSPSSFVLQGTSSSVWNNVVTGLNTVYQASTYKILNGYYHTGLYSSYRLHINGPAGSTINIYEMQPLICSVTTPTSITFEIQSYTYYTKYESVFIAPTVTEFSNCQINPQLPAGLTFHAEQCFITGKASNAQPSTQYTMTTTVNGQQLSGSFSLQFNDCTGNLIKVLRTYKTNAAYEAFTIRDTATQQVVLQVNSNSGQINSQDWETVLCLTGQKYTITVGSTSSYWSSSSFLYLNAILDDNDYDTITRVRFDNNLGLSSSYTVPVVLAVKPAESWYYKMGEVPSNWFNSETSGWTSGTVGTFPASSNQIQLYKKTFNVASLTDIAGLVVSIKYQYGVIIYLNNHEVFRKGFTGDLSTSSYSSTSLADVNFRQISLPIKTFGTSETPSVDYVTVGTNTIAIGLVAAGPAQTTSSFDCAVRLMTTSSRLLDYTVAYSSINGSMSTLGNDYYGTSLYHSTCDNNYYQITFKDDRHEWISSVGIKLYYTQSIQQVRKFTLKAKNAEDTTWTTLKEVDGMTWSLAGQRNRIWIVNNKSYNQYRFENFGTGNPSACYWKFGSLQLLSDVINGEVPALSYPATTIYKDIEMGEVYANSDLYFDFSITPALPEGIILDPHTGTISGTTNQLVSTQMYSVSAKKFSGETVNAQFNFGVEICTGGKSLITLVARTDGSPTQSSYVLYEGKGTTGTVKASIDRFATANTLNYGDFCLLNGIYTLQLKDTSTGWTNPAGYYLTVDVGEMKFEMGQVYGTTPASVTTMFSSYLPFQVDYDDWKVYTAIEAIAADWNSINFNDASWAVTKAASIGKSEAITVYIRRDITLDDASNYQVLNIRMKYAGGVVAYFNGRKVARFNLIEDFDAQTQSIEVHDSTVFSQFHIVLPTSGAVTGKNVIAFEIHRPFGQSSAEPVVFDATGVFGVNDCSIGVDSVINVSGTAGITIGKLENFFDLTPVTYGYQANAAGTNLQWTVENLEGTKFNSFALQTVYKRTSWGFSLYGRFTPSEDPEDLEAEEYTSIFAQLDLETVERGRAAWPVPVGIAGFRQFKHVVDDTASSTVYISAYIFQYCKPAGTGVCPAIGEYPSVAEGEISPAECEYGFRGYSYRECTNGQLSEIKTDKCTYKIPSNLAYDSDRYTLVLNTQVNIAKPTYTNLITKFYLAENTFLPDGLTLDETTGVITGKPTSESALKTYTIYGENLKGVTSTTINISVRKGECKAEGNFPKTHVGDIATYDCALGGNYVGTQKRVCLLGAKDGEWQKIQGTCMPTMMIVIIVIVVIVIVAIVLFFIVRATKKTKAVGGVKGKKSMKSTKSSVSKKSTEKKGTKSVKV